MQAVILCGGLGTRLGQLTEKVPKPMIEICGKPFLEHQVDMLANQGFNRFLFLTGHMGEQIASHFKTYNANCAFSQEPEPLGTGGALVYAKDKLEEVFLLLNGDTYLPVNYNTLVKSFDDSSLGMLAAFKPAQQTALVETRNLAINGNRVILYQKRSLDPRLSHIDAGVQVFRKEILNLAPSDKFSLEQQLWPKIIEQGKMQAYEVDVPPYDIGTPERITIFQQYLEGRK